MVYASRIVPSLAKASARPPAYYVAAIPAIIASAVTLARLIGFTTGSVRDDIILIAATVGVACSWGPIVHGALSVTGGPTAQRAPAWTEGDHVDDDGARTQAARTVGFGLGVSLFMVTMISFAVPAAASFVACLDTEGLLAGAEPPPPNIAPMEDAFNYNQPEAGAQRMLDFPMSLDLAAESRHDPETRDQLVAAGYVGGHVRSWIGEDSNWIEAEVMEFATAEGAATYQGQVNRHACGYANEAFEAPMGGIGLQVRYETGAPYVEQISWVADNRRYKVQISAYERPSDHSRILGIQEVTTRTWPPAAAPTAEEPATSATPEASVSETSIDEVRAAVETTLAEGTVWINKKVTFAGSSEIPDDAAAFAGGQASLYDTTQMRLMVQSADTAADFEGSSMQVILDGTKLYLSSRALGPYIGNGLWLVVDLDSNDPRAEPFKALVSDHRALVSGHNDAAMALFYLYGTTRVLGVSDDVVHEQAAHKYSVEIDLEAALDALPPEHVDGFGTNLSALREAGVDTNLDAEIWVGRDGLVHHIDFVQGLGATMGGGSMTTSVDFSDFAVPLDLDLPPPEHIKTVEDVKDPGQQQLPGESP